MSLVEDKLAKAKRLDLQIAIHYRDITPTTVLVLIEIEDSIIPVMFIETVETSMHADAVFQTELRTLIDGWISRTVTRIDPSMTFESDQTGRPN